MRTRKSNQHGAWQGAVGGKTNAKGLREVASQEVKAARMREHWVHMVTRRL